MKLSIKDLASIDSIEFRNKDLLRGKAITGVSTDSRNIGPGNVFVALRGENFDGHAFVASAFAKGASAAIVDASFNIGGISDKPLLVVENTVQALGRLAHLHRMKFSIPVVAIGGSNGKTTTKDMVARVLSSKYSVLHTEGNLNNHIGVPQTLLRLTKKHDVAVVEVGTNHPGEIEYLCGILAPTHGLITNIGREHLEFFATIDGVAEEEGALFRILKGRKTSVLFVNKDDVRVSSLAKGMKGQRTYGIQSKRVDVRGRLVGTNESGCARLEYISKKPVKYDQVTLSIPGEHNAMNALAAVTVGLAFKVPTARIRTALKSFRPSSKRMEMLNFEGVIIYNDSYNANPDSMVQALRTLAAAKVTGKRIAVLGDMRELGDSGKEHHALVGREAARLGIDYVLTYGELARFIHEAATVPFAIHYEQKNMLAEYLAELIAPGDAVLVKGSRGMNMEDVVMFLGERLRTAVVPLG